ncbi:MAG: hypothetical protein H6810_00100 [Phycisphaeraceae bacterium]|nr:MAG: hypothetical protein H6810_00100 [Phycisphaeraceae bacterium]
MTSTGRVLRVGVHRDEVVWKLEVMSRRGRLPGFRRTLDGCAVAAHGNPFDKVLYLRAADHAGKGSAFTTELKLERKMPTIAAVLFIATIWPGVILTDSFLRINVGFYDRWTTGGLQTWWWYIPLTIIGVVWAWFGAIAKSNRTAQQSADETLEKIAAEVGGTIESA